MADELTDWFVHTVTATPEGGTGAWGPVAGTPATLHGFLDDTRRLVRSSSGEETVSESTFYTSIDNADALQPGTEVDLSYRTATVIGQNRHTAPGLDLPEHLEVTLT